jgi:hypothetical protein
MRGWWLRWLSNLNTPRRVRDLRFCFATLDSIDALVQSKALRHEAPFTSPKTVPRGRRTATWTFDFSKTFLPPMFGCYTSITSVRTPKFINDTSRSWPFTLPRKTLCTVSLRRADSGLVLVPRQTYHAFTTCQLLYSTLGDVKNTCSPLCTRERSTLKF